MPYPIPAVIVLITVPIAADFRDSFRISSDDFCCGFGFSVLFNVSVIAVPMPEPIPPPAIVPAAPNSAVPPDWNNPLTAPPTHPFKKLPFFFSLAIPPTKPPHDVPNAIPAAATAIPPDPATATATTMAAVATTAATANTFAVVSSHLGRCPSASL